MSAYRQEKRTAVTEPVWRQLGIAPAFPQWIRRMDPLLEREDENVLFHVFRLRRKYGKQTWTRRSARWLRSSPLFSTGMLVAIGAAILIVTASSFAPAFGFLAALLLALVYAITHTVLRRSLHQLGTVRPSMPQRLANVYSARGFLLPAAEDIWMTGATGKEVAMALYLESRESTWKWIAGASAAVGASAMVGFCIIHSEPEIWNYLILTATAFLSYEFLLLMLVLGAGSANRRAVSDRLRAWTAKSPLRSSIMSSVGCSVFAGSSLFILALFFAYAPPIRIVQSWDVLTSKIAALIWIILLGLIVHGLRKVLRESFEWAGEQYLWEANAAYERFMSAVVMHDPDGEVPGRIRAMNALMQSTPDLKSRHQR